MQLGKRVIHLIVLLLVLGTASQWVYARENEWPSGIEPTAIVRFATIGDPHYGWRDVDHWYARDIVEAWMHDEQFPAVDFGVNLGDFVSGDHYDTLPEIEAMWEHAMTDSFSRLLIPWVFAMGNHDVEEGMPNISTDERVAIAKRETGVMSRAYAIMWNNVLFLIQGWHGRGGMTEAHKAWFRCMTQLYPDTTTVIVRHPGPDEWFEELFRDNPQIALYIYGHGHEFRKRVVEGVQVVEYGHTNNSLSWAGRPWTGVVEMTESGITGRLYDVVQKAYVEEARGFSLDVTTTVKPTGLEWYAWAMFVEDGDQFTIDNRILAEEYYLEFVGAEPVDGRLTTDFTVILNDKRFAIPQLEPLQTERFVLEADLLTNELQFTADIGGSGQGFVQMVYFRPSLWSSHVSISPETTGASQKAHLERVARYTVDNQIILYPLQPGVDVPEAEPVTVRDRYTAFRIADAALPATVTVNQKPALPPRVELTDFVVPASVQQFDRFPVTAVITNTGGPVQAKVSLWIDGERVQTQYVDLRPNESVSVEFYLEFTLPGEYILSLDGQEGKSVEVVAGLPF